jgi:hypothetical protein
MAKERMQNPAVGDNINLRLFTYNSNNLADLSSISKVDIYYLDQTFVSADNPDGRRLVHEFDGSAVTAEDTGTYLLQVSLDENLYVIGRYIDVWTVNVSDDQPSEHIEQVFDVYPKLWYSTPTPIVYDFNFHFQPNKLRKGSKQYLIIEIVPNVPTAGDLRKYYENLAIVSDLKISIEQACGDCVPAEDDLRLVVDAESVDYREKRYGFYKLDTTDMDCGVYHIWFQLDFGGNTYLSDKLHLQIFD